MPSLRRVLVRIVSGSVVAVAAFCAWVCVSNQRLLRADHAVVPIALRAASGPEAVARGHAIAQLTGCTDCHRADLRGGVFSDGGWLHGRYYAANLTLKAQACSDADLARIIRLGVRPDGRGVVVMPSFAYVRLTDAETADLIAFIRSMPVGGEDPPSHTIGPLDQWALWRGDGFKPSVSYVAGELRKAPADLGPRFEAARHLAGTVCAECHGGDLKGNGWDSGAPDLAVAAAYDLPQFVRLLRTGIGRDDKDHGLMSEIARGRLKYLSDDQIAGLHAYLVARAARAP